MGAILTEDWSIIMVDIYIDEKTLNRDLELDHCLVTEALLCTLYGDEICKQNNLNKGNRLEDNIKAVVHFGSNKVIDEALATELNNLFTEFIASNNIYLGFKRYSNEKKCKLKVVGLSKITNKNMMELPKSTFNNLDIGIEGCTVSINWTWHLPRGENKIC